MMYNSTGHDDVQFTEASAGPLLNTESIRFKNHQKMKSLTRQPSPLRDIKMRGKPLPIRRG